MPELILKPITDNAELKKLVHDLVGQMAPLVEAMQKEGMIGGGTGAGFGKDCARSPFGNGICVGGFLPCKPAAVFVVPAAVLIGDAGQEGLKRARVKQAGLSLTKSNFK